MIVLYHLANSRSDRIIWLLEELGLEYELHTFERDPETGRAPAEMKAMHPYAKSPMLGDGDRLLIESGAIVEYVLAHYGKGQLEPNRDDPSWPDYIQWLHFAEGSAMLPFLLDHFQEAGLCGPPGEAPIAAMAKAGLDDVYAYLEGALKGKEWLAGNVFSAADIMMGWVVEIADNRGELEGRPELQRYLESIRARPAHRAAAARALG